MEKFRYYTIDPPAELARYVRSFWVFEGSGHVSEPYIYRSMADACAEMVFHYKGAFNGISKKGVIDENAGNLAMLQGPTRQYKRFVVNEDFGIFGAYLYPFAIPDIFRLSSLEIQNETPSIIDSFGSEGRILSERILSAGNNNERVLILSDYLIRKVQQFANPDSTLHDCIKHFIFSRDPVRIEETSRQFNISARQLERKFKTITGLTPKTYSRISRFQQAMKNYGSKYKNLTDIAYECGYYDQSHFIHDFREFSGYEPGTYFAGKAEGIEYRG